MRIRFIAYRLLLCFSMMMTTLSSQAVRYQKGDFVYDCNFSWHQLSATLMQYTGAETNVTIPSSVEYDGNIYPILYIGDEFSKPFIDNATVERVSLPDCAMSIGVEAFCNCQSLREVDLGRGLQRIGAYAFFHCLNLEHVTIHNELTDVEEYAFAECDQLTQLTLARSVSHLGDYVFDRTPLKTLTVLNAMPPECSGKMSSDTTLYSSCSVNVRIGSLSSFLSAEEWNRFEHIQERPEFGDINIDGSIDIQDINSLINMMLGRTPADLEYCDLDQNGMIDITDLNILLNIMLGKTEI